jgi:hypothetical protein
MRRSPPLAPGAPQHDVTVHIVVDDFGELGRAYRETDEAEADERTIIDDILTDSIRGPFGSLPSRRQSNGRAMCRKT